MDTTSTARKNRVERAIKDEGVAQIIASAQSLQSLRTHTLRAVTIIVGSSWYGDIAG
jgi:hypothetical protein